MSAQSEEKSFSQFIVSNTLSAIHSISAEHTYEKIIRSIIKTAEVEVLNIPVDCHVPFLHIIQYQYKKEKETQALQPIPSMKASLGVKTRYRARSVP